MTPKTQYLLIAIVLFVVIAMSLGCSCYQVKPYFRDSLFSNQYPYEGFDLSPSNYEVSGNARVTCGNTKSMPVEGFEGLQSAPYAKSAPIDTFSQAVGGLECKSYGYTNSKGPLCLDATQVRLLSTRGGNATGIDSQIGPQ